MVQRGTTEKEKKNSLYGGVRSNNSKAEAGKDAKGRGKKASVVQRQQKKVVLHGQGVRDDS